MLPYFRYLLYYIQIQYICVLFFSVVLFTFVHIPNRLLIKISFIFGMAAYSMFNVLYYYCPDYYVFAVWIPFVLIHAVYGRALKINGVNMKVLFFYSASDENCRSN